jgi:hypothetical protein
MIRRLGALFAFGIVLATSPVFALTATWKNNTEPDMKDYLVYMCKVKGCVVQQIPAQHVATVPFNAAVVPTWVMPSDIEGTLAVTARDTSGNESGLSNQVPFDLSKPSTPSGLATK